MKPESTPFYGVGVALLLAAAWFLDNYEGYRFPEPDSQQFCQPQVSQDQFRWGRVMALDDGSHLEPNVLVRYKVPRLRKEVTSRVIALEGQRVRIDEGKVYVDGKPFADPYARARGKADYFPELVVPAGSVFVLNDQRMRQGADRMDSRSLGPIPLRAISLCFAPRERKSGRRRR
ncbi:MAG: signal peptidase I [Planctomycetota bacterium]|nr:MAG: signal peptidase I [Planctomycetota bacterium]